MHGLSTRRTCVLFGFRKSCMRTSTYLYNTHAMQHGEMLSQIKERPFCFVDASALGLLPEFGQPSLMVPFSPFTNLRMLHYAYGLRSCSAHISVAGAHSHVTVCQMTTFSVDHSSSFVRSFADIVVEQTEKMCLVVTQNKPNFAYTIV